MQSGEYSVKSGYFFLKAETSNNSSSTQILQGTTKPPWKQVWQLAVPSKIKIFLWRATRNALPTNVNLVRRCVMVDPTCCACQNNEEDVLHSLWSCPSLSQVWNEDPRWNSLQSTRHSDFAQLLAVVFASDCSLELFAFITWTIWLK